MEGGKNPKVLPIILEKLLRTLTDSSRGESPPLQLPPHPAGLINGFPDDLSYKILLAYLQKQSLKTVLQCRCASKAFRDLIDNSLRCSRMCRDEVWLVSTMNMQTVFMEFLNLTRGEKDRVFLPTDLQSRAAADLREGKSLRLRPLSGDFGSGLVILEIFSSLASNNPRDRFVFNPINGTYVRFPVSYRGEDGHRFDVSERIGRFKTKSEYLVLGDMRPRKARISEPQTSTWRSIRSDLSDFPFGTNSSVQLATACVGNISYMRYEAKHLRDLVIEYHVGDDRLFEKKTAGLPESQNSKFDYLFEHQGGVYLGTVLSKPEREIDEVVVFKLNAASATGDGGLPRLKWMEISRVPLELLAEISGSYSRKITRGLRFILVKGVLLVVSGRAGTPRSRGDIQPNVLAYDFARGSWERYERASMLAFNFQSFVFRPSLDIKA